MEHDDLAASCITFVGELADENVRLKAENELLKAELEMVQNAPGAQQGTGDSHGVNSNICH